MKSLLLPLLLLLSLPAPAQQFITSDAGTNNFPLVVSGKATALYVSDEDYPGVVRAAGDLQADIERVTETKPSLTTGKIAEQTELVIIGTIGESPVIDQLIKNKKIDADVITGKWENYLIQVVDDPLPKVKRALVIAGSDKRGAIFGIYDLSRQIGVSPWYWWADVPVKKKTALYAQPGRYVSDGPAVKYRGIFINDEQPALGGWVRENYGGFNHEFYEKVFELILRMKGNFLWPAMWGQSFASDDPLSAKLADEYGVVISTSHHEPLMRAHVEWQREGKGEWNYATNEENLRAFWRKGMERMNDYESVVTLAMRGDGDEAMTAGTNIALLEKIVRDQREIIAGVTKKDITATPQVWALYKEVQDYYDQGMRVPDDVTLLLCDDNWGNIRKLPKLTDPKRSGGYGIYYHYDYVGGPRNYKWLNTNPLPRIWEQMHLAYRHGVDRIWIVNVGDIKPMEFPIEFFLDYAWDPEKWNQDNLDDYTRQWAAYQFGDKHAAEIARILATYTKFNARRKPELLSPDTYSLINYREAETVVAGYNQLAADAEIIYNDLPPEYKDAYYQLVLFPVQACANLNELHVTTALNRLYAKQGRAKTNTLADRVGELFRKDSALTHYYNKIMAGGKWNHMMDQTHISYTYWQQPEKDVVPETTRLTVPTIPEMGVAIEGSALWWPQEKNKASLPAVDAYYRQARYIEVFNRGQSPFGYTITTSVPWVKVSHPKETIETEQRVEVMVDWNKVPAGIHQTVITVTSDAGKSVSVGLTVSNPASPKPGGITGHIEGNGCVSIESAHFTRAVNTADITWKILPGLGRTLSGVTTFPVTARTPAPGGTSPRLEYDVYLFSSGEVTIRTYVSPTIDFHNSGGLRYAVSVDDAPPQIINIHADNSNGAWNRSVANNIITTESKHTIAAPGKHTIKYWMVDNAVVLQKVVVETGEVAEGYLGPPERAVAD